MTKEPPLARVVGVWGAVWMGLGSILGTGVFVSLGIAAGLVGSGVLLAVGLAALVATANGLSSAQLAAARPVSGGTYEHAHIYVHPAAGFAAGWMFLAAKSASAATAALGCSGYLLRALGLGHLGQAHVGLALAIVLALTALVAGGVRRSSAANIIIVSITLSALGAFVLFGWASVVPAELLARLHPSTWTVALNDPGALLHATALLFVAYTGYGRIATLGEEVREPERTIPVAIITTIGLSMLLYVAVGATAVAVVGAETFASAARDGGASLEAIARTFRHPRIAWLVAAGGVTAMAGVLLNLVLGLSRVVLAMARRKDLPASLQKVDAKTSSPARAVWVVGAVIGALVLVGDLKTTWGFSAFTVLVYYGLTNLAALCMPRAARRFPAWVAVAGLVSCLGLASFIPWPIGLAGLVVLAAGFALRRGAFGGMNGR